MAVSTSGSRAIAGLLAVGVLGAWGAANSYQVSANYAEHFPDIYGGERAQARFAAVAARVPASAELGYLTDLKPGEADYAAFLSAQYALAPRILAYLGEQATPEWAVGNFSKPADFSAAGEALGYTMIADLGNGVILFRRKS
jgi:hypothetical protein